MSDLAVRLQPKAGRNEISGERDGMLLVRVAAAPVDGKANAALCKLIAKRLGIARSRVTLVSGDRDRDKRLEIEGMSAPEVRQALKLEG